MLYKLIYLKWKIVLFSVSVFSPEEEEDLFRIKKFYSIFTYIVNISIIRMFGMIILSSICVV